MRTGLALPVLTAVFLAAGTPSAAPAQGSAGPLLQAPWRELQAEVQRRYNLGLAVSQDPATINADNVRYLWALEAKVQCGIAIGYLKSGNRDPISIGKCQSASDRLQLAAAPAAPPEAPATQTCPDGSVILATSACPAAAPPPPPPPAERGGGATAGTDVPQIHGARTTVR